MPKAYWISAYRAIKNPDNLAAYAKLAGPAIATDERLTAALQPTREARG